MASWLQEFKRAIGFGQVPGYRRITALGNNPDVDTGAQEDIWTGGGLYPWLTGATSLEIVSDSANDTAAGTGARTVQGNFLDTAHAEFSSTVTLNGLTPVPFPSQAFRINSALIMSAGSGKTNAGTLTIRDAGGGTTRAIIPAGIGITQQSIFTVPAGYTLSIDSHLGCINRNTGVGRYATIANFIQSPNGFYRMPLQLSVSDQTPYRHEGEPGIIVSEKNDYCLRVLAVSSDNTDLTGGWLGVLKSNTVN